MKNLKFYLGLIGFIPMFAFAQPYKFEQTLQITGNDYIYSTDIVSSTTDYVSAGFTNVNSANSGADVLVFTWDDNGYGTNRITRYTGPGNKPDIATKVLKTSDGGFLVVGNTSSYRGGTKTEAFAMKLNSNLQVSV